MKQVSFESVQRGVPRKEETRKAEKEMVM